MAIIIFRLLNNGIHPYQGIDVERFDNPTTLQDCIFAGLYAYGGRDIAVSSHCGPAFMSF
jgi:DNA-binding helix-hairpin-helix protein with protein kinase domain